MKETGCEDQYEPRVEVGATDPKLFSCVHPLREAAHSLGMRFLVWGPVANMAAQLVACVDVADRGGLAMAGNFLFPMMGSGAAMANLDGDPEAMFGGQRVSHALTAATGAISMAGGGLMDYALWVNHDGATFTAGIGVSLAGLGLGVVHGVARLIHSSVKKYNY